MNLDTSYQSKRLKFFVPSLPIPKGRPRLGMGGARTPQRTKTYEELVGFHAMLAVAAQDWEMPIDAPLLAILQFRFDKPRKNNGDIDNLCKSVLDGMNAVAFQDDSQIQAIVANKTYGYSGENIGVAIELRYWFEELSVLDNLIGYGNLSGEYR